jgi:predicted lipoprotein with Yx(FWY)xxD motif
MRTFIVTAAVSGALMATGSLAALAQDAAELTVRESPEHGQYVADGEGMALYMFEADTRGEGDTEAVSTCYDDCAGAWPPLVAEEAQAGDQVESDLIGTIERRDGEMQVTYGGWPLYYFVRDEAAGDTNGQDVEGFGAEWYLVSPSGEIVGD